MSEVKPFFRRIRSFVRRDGRMTEGQRRAMELLWPTVGLTLTNDPAEFSARFPANIPRILEIGFGSGSSLLAMAKAHPEQQFIGVEMYQPGIGALLQGMIEQDVKNIHVYYADAVEVLTQCIPDESLDVIQIFFPDPWPKRRHHKRRLIQPEFVSLLVKKLKKNATLHLATDWQHYAEHMMEVLSAETGLMNLSGDKQYSNRSSQRPVITKFERRGEASGRQIWELQFCKSLTMRD